MSTITDNDLISLGFEIKSVPCIFYGTKNIFLIEGRKMSEEGWSDGFDSSYIIERIKNESLIKITRIDVGGFRGDETKEQLFLGSIEDKGTLMSILTMIGCPFTHK